MPKAEAAKCLHYELKLTPTANASIAVATTKSSFHKRERRGALLGFFFVFLRSVFFEPYSQLYSMFEPIKPRMTETAPMHVLLNQFCVPPTK